MQGWYNSGKKLLSEITSMNPGQGILPVWYLGQAGMALNIHGTALGIDLYLRDADRRLLPAPFSPEEAGQAFDILLCTHNHEDHLDTASIARMADSPVRFVIPAPWISVLEDLGISRERIVPAVQYEPIEIDGFTIIPVPAAHEGLDADKDGHLYCLGYILDTGSVRFYHAGDTIEWESMVEEISAQHPDVMALPINGCDWNRRRRNIVGNLNPREASDIAADCRADLVIPLHYDMFAGNDENPAVFADYMHRNHSGRKFHIFQPGECYLYKRP